MFERNTNIEKVILASQLGQKSFLHKGNDGVNFYNVKVIKQIQVMRRHSQNSGSPVNNGQSISFLNRLKPEPVPQNSCSRLVLHPVSCNLNYYRTSYHLLVGSMEAPSKAFLFFFLLPDWLKFNHLKSRMECGFSDIFSRHICSIAEETISVTNYAASFGAKKCSENHI